MKQGTLIFDEYRDRYDIRFDLTCLVNKFGFVCSEQTTAVRIAFIL